MITAWIITILLVAQLPVLFIMCVFLGVGGANGGHGAAAFAIPFLIVLGCGYATASRAFGRGITTAPDFVIAAIAFAPLAILGFWVAQEMTAKVFTKLGS